MNRDLEGELLEAYKSNDISCRYTPEQCKRQEKIFTLLQEVHHARVMLNYILNEQLRENHESIRTN